MLKNAMAPADILKLSDARAGLGLTEEEWRRALETAEADPKVGIKHASIKGHPSDRFHVASIPQRVSCHFHRLGDEDYSVVQGSGTIFFGEVSEDGGTAHVRHWHMLPVECGQSFTIPQGFAHQLCANPASSLVIVFRCPDSHLTDQDRTILADCPLACS